MMGWYTPTGIVDTTGSHGSCQSNQSKLNALKLCSIHTDEALKRYGGNGFKDSQVK